MATSGLAGEIERLLAAGDERRRARDLEGALDAYAKAAEQTEVPVGAACVRLARAYAEAGDVDAACSWALRTVDAGDDFASWDAAGQLIERLGVQGETVKRTVRVAVLGSYTTAYLTRLLKLVSARRGIDMACYEAGFNLFRQELLDPRSGLHGFAPELIVFAIDARAVGLPGWSDDPHGDVEAELSVWQELWGRAAELGATVVQHNVVVPPEAALAHYDAQLPGTRLRMLSELNTRLADAAPAHVHVVDCDRVASRFGKDAWCDPLWWDRAKLAVALPATPLLARHTAAVIAGGLGLARKCLVLDLDNTVWGGVIGEDGIAGIALGGDAAGAAYLEFQERVLALKRRGVVLAASSRNDEHIAREPFERHPDMRLSTDDFAAFVANWGSKVENIKQIAADLALGLDALTYIDDNPVERQEVRRFLPDVDVVPMPEQPSLYARTLADYVWFETGTFTAEDAHRTDQYRARSDARILERSAASIEDFYRDLRMVGVVGPFVAEDLVRIAQLIGKTNQFNVTGRRRDLGAVEALADDPTYVHRSLRLRDRFTDHGLVGVIIGRVDGTTLDIDTWLLSCRVISRTAEHALLGALAQAARGQGCTEITGTYVPSSKNALVRDLYASFGFTQVGDDRGVTTWRRPIDADLLAGSPYIEVAGEDNRGAA